MRETINNEIRRYVKEDQGNRFPENGTCFFDEPLIGFVSADDPLFTTYKAVIGEFHLTPHELLSASPGENSWQPATVICWVLPITLATRVSNRDEPLYPSRQWAHTRSFGESFNTALRRHMVAFLTARGYHAAAPQLLAAWQEYRDTPVGIASSWSERHAAYAAGLGTFSLNDGLITPKGIAHRLGSVLTNLQLEPSPRPYRDHRVNCLYYREGSCGICIGRCPADALSFNGHDKSKCRAHVYGASPEAVGDRYGVSNTGCGLCQTKVPCEERIPAGQRRSRAD
jgi:epoxyqueuosine reductase QueG